MKKFESVCEELESIIQNAYENGVTLEEAEKHAGRFLHAQMVVSAELKNADLDARMKKSGVKAMRALAYGQACEGKDKKPTESALEHAMNTHELVQTEQNSLDTAEVSKDELTRYYNIFREGHIYFRGIGKGRYE